MSVQTDFRNAAVGVIVGGSLAYGLAEKPEQEQKALNLILFGCMIWVTVFLIARK